MISNIQKGEINVFVYGQIPLEGRRCYDDYLEEWSDDLFGPQASLRFVQVLEVYWRLTSLMFNIKQHHGMIPKFWSWTELMEETKIARDEGDLATSRKIWDQMVALWLQYLNDQKTFQSNIAQ